MINECTAVFNKVRSSGWVVWTVPSSEFWVIYRDRPLYFLHESKKYVFSFEKKKTKSLLNSSPPINCFTVTTVFFIHLCLGIWFSHSYKRLVTSEMPESITFGLLFQIQEEIHSAKALCYNISAPCWWLRWPNMLHIKTNAHRRINQ